MMMDIVYPVSNTLQRLTLRLFADYKVTGQEKVPRQGPLIIVANHQSNLDPPLIGASIPRRAWFLAKQGVFRGPIVHWFLKNYGAFPLDRGAADVRAYRWALNKLAQGQAMAIYPEGTRSRGAMRKAKTGIIRLALKAQAPLLPVGITGTERIGSWMRAVNPTGKIRVNIGEPFHLPPIRGRPSTEDLESLTNMVMRRIAALLPESYHGVYSLTS